MAIRTTIRASGALFVHAVLSPFGASCGFERQNSKKSANGLKTIAALGAFVVIAWARDAMALEGPAPYLPGVTVGIPTGVLPPPGFYFSDRPGSTPSSTSHRR
jgi:hypothetical protein